MDENISFYNAAAPHAVNEREDDTYILAIESSCDETSAAVVRNGRDVLSNIIASQIDIHKLYGGVVPEIASDRQIQNLIKWTLYALLTVRGWSARSLWEYRQQKQ